MKENYLNRYNINVNVLPSNFKATPGNIEFSNNFMSLVKEYLDLCGSQKKDIFIKRWALDGVAKKEKLRVIGESYNVTRERIRQISAHLIYNLKKLIKAGTIIRPPCKLNLSFFLEIDRTRNKITSQLIHKKENLYNSIPHTDESLPFLKLFFELINMKEVKINGYSYVIYTPEITEEEFITSYKKIESYLQDIDEPSTITDIHNNVDVKFFNVDLIVKTMHIVESTINNSGQEAYQIKFKYLKSVLNKSYRILSGSKKPLHKNDIASRIEELCGSCTEIIPFSMDSRFSPVGGTGFWGLSSWNIKTETIKEMVCRLLNTLNKPMFLKEMENIIKENREDISLNSLRSVIRLENNLFSFLEDGRVILKEWFPKYEKNLRVVGEKIICTQNNYDQFLIELLKDKELTTTEIIKESQKKFTLTDNGVLAKIIKSAVLKKRREKNHSYYSLKANYNEILNSVKKKPVKKIIQEVAKDLLYQNKKPMLLNVLIKHLTSNLNFSKQTIYGALSPEIFLKTYVEKSNKNKKMIYIKN